MQMINAAVDDSIVNNLIVDIGLTVAMVYLLIGAIVAITFLAIFANRLDYAMRGTSLITRFVLFPGCVLFWPFVLIRIVSRKAINDLQGET